MKCFDPTLAPLTVEVIKVQCRPGLQSFRGIGGVLAVCRGLLLFTTEFIDFRVGFYGPRIEDLSDSDFDEHLRERELMIRTCLQRTISTLGGGY